MWMLGFLVGCAQPERVDITANADPDLVGDAENELTLGELIPIAPNAHLY